MMFEIYLADEADTMREAGKLALAIDQVFNRSALVFLDGQMGAGKTTFSRGIMRAYGFKGAVKSPTFTIVEPYDLPGGQVYHFDLYRLNDPEELHFLGIDDYLEGRQLCLIEWSERGLDFLPECDLRVHLTVVGTGRNLLIEGNSDGGKDVCEIMKREKT